MGDNLRDAVCPAGMGKIKVVLRRMMAPDWPGNVLLNVLLQSLGHTFYVPTCCCHRHLEEHPLQVRHKQDWSQGHVPTAQCRGHQPF